MTDRINSIFREYFAQHPFVDRFSRDASRAVDVLVPVIHTNELWEANLCSFYREIPVARLLIGDGGCIDDSLDIARHFPRVTVLDHRQYNSLGYSIRKLIEEVSTEWFVYVHSDAFLPPGWFDAMLQHQSSYDWFGCPMRHTVMVEYDLDYGARPWAGTQMGRRIAFDPSLSRIEDDFVYRQEDFVFSDVVRRNGFREGKVTDTFHYHQTMRKPSPSGRKVTSVHIGVQMNRAEEIRTWTMQANGIIKYLQPDNPWVISSAISSVDSLVASGEATWPEYSRWVAKTNPSWLRVIERGLRRRRMGRVARRIFSSLRSFLS